MQQVQSQSTNNESTKERAYLEKIKVLKAENKKLISLLRDSEKLFYQKLKETKKESENLSALFKQLWPLIKHKVKDPNGLLKTVNGLQGEQTEQANEKIQELYKTQVKKREFMIKNNVHVSDKMLKVEDLMKNRSIIRS